MTDDSTPTNDAVPEPESATEPAPTPEPGPGGESAPTAVPAPTAEPAPAAQAAPPAEPPTTSKRPIYKTWWFWVIAVLLVGALAYGLSLAVGDGTDGTGTDDPTSEQPASEPSTATPGEPGTTSPKEPTQTTPGSRTGSAAESQARAYAPDITAWVGVSPIEEIIDQMEASGHEDYKETDGDGDREALHLDVRRRQQAGCRHAAKGDGGAYVFERVDIED